MPIQATIAKIKRQKSKAREIHAIERKRLKASLERMEQTLTTERAQLQRVTAKRDAHATALEALKQRMQRVQRRTEQTQEDARRKAKAEAEASLQKRLFEHEQRCEEITRDLEEMEQIARFHEDSARKLKERMRACEAGECKHVQRMQEALQQAQSENTTLFEQIAVYENVLQEQEEELVQANRRNQLDCTSISSPRAYDDSIHVISPRQQQQQQSPCAGKSKCTASEAKQPLHELQPRHPRSPMPESQRVRPKTKEFATLGEEARAHRFGLM